MLPLSLSTSELEKDAAAALAEAVVMRTAAWNYVYTHMVAVALRFVLPRMYQIPRTTPLEQIVRQGWRLARKFMSSPALSDFRNHLGEELLVHNHESIPEDQWRSTTRLATMLAIFTTAVKYVPDQNFSTMDRMTFMRSIFLGLMDLPWYLPRKLEEIPLGVATATVKIFNALMYVPNTKKRSDPQAGASCTTARKNFRVLYKLLLLYKMEDVRCTPPDLFSRIRTVVAMRGPSDPYLPTLLDHFRETYLAQQEPTLVVQPLVQQNTDKKKLGGSGGTTVPQRAKIDKELRRSTIDWPLEFTDNSCTQLRSPRDGDPPVLEGYKTLIGSAERWREKVWRAELARVQGPPAAARPTREPPPLPTAAVEVVRPTTLPPPILPNEKSEQPLSQNELDDIHYTDEEMDADYLSNAAYMQNPIADDGSDNTFDDDLVHFDVFAGTERL